MAGKLNLNSGCRGNAGLDGRIQILFSRHEYSSLQGRLSYNNKPLKFFFTDPAEYHLQDPDFEKKFNCNITKTLQKPDRHKLFEVRAISFTFLKVKIFRISIILTELLPINF